MARCITASSSVLVQSICGGCEHCRGNDEQFGRIKVLNNETFGGKYVPRVVLMDLEPGVIDAATLSRRSASSSAREN
jgi:hypothetical protein